MSKREGPRPEKFRVDTTSRANTSYHLHDSVILEMVQRRMKRLHKIPNGRRVTKLRWVEDGDYWIVETKSRSD